MAKFSTAAKLGGTVVREHDLYPACDVLRRQSRKYPHDRPGRQLGCDELQGGLRWTVRLCD
jgi:hypothetical protein